MPRAMRCTACQAVSYQAALSVRATLAARYKDDLLGAITLEALQGLCASEGFWGKEYGLMPTASGYNVYNGTGVTLPEGADFVNNDVMMSVAHTDTQGKKLAAVCEALLLGADAMEEEDFAALALMAASDEDAVVRFRAALCEGAGQSCAAAA